MKVKIEMGPDVLHRKARDINATEPLKRLLKGSREKMPATLVTLVPPSEAAIAGRLIEGSRDDNTGTSSNPPEASIRSGRTGCDPPKTASSPEHPRVGSGAAAPRSTGSRSSTRSPPRSRHASRTSPGPPQSFATERPRYRNFPTTRTPIQKEYLRVAGVALPDSDHVP